MSTEVPESNDLLEELSRGEDEFDVDLMACGCRLAPAGRLELSIYDLARLYNLGENELIALVGALMDEGRIPHDKVHELADKAARGEIREEDVRRRHEH